MVVLGLMGCFEQVAIFPVNDRILAFGGEKPGRDKGVEKHQQHQQHQQEEKEMDDCMTAAEKGELERLLGVWAERHVWRIVAPGLCGLVTFGIAVSQPC